MRESFRRSAASAASSSDRSGGGLGAAAADRRLDVGPDGDRHRLRRVARDDRLDLRLGRRGRVGRLVPAGAGTGHEGDRDAQDHEQQDDVLHLRACEVFRRVRAGAPDGAELGAKRSRSSGYGEHLQRRVGAFGRDQRA